MSLSERRRGSQRLLYETDEQGPPRFSQSFEDPAKLVIAAEQMNLLEGVVSKP